MTARCLLAAVVLLACVPVLAQAPIDTRQQVARVLDQLHHRAGQADYAGYFELFDDGAVFMGTDRAEYWPLAEFQAYTRQRFAAGSGWTYVPTERIIHVHGDVAWFEERLQHGRFGEFRGTGVLVNTAAGWRIRQYNLTLPIPNELFESVGGRIVSHYAQDKPSG